MTLPLLSLPSFSSSCKTGGLVQGTWALKSACRSPSVLIAASRGRLRGEERRVGTTQPADHLFTEQDSYLEKQDATEV